MPSFFLSKQTYQKHLYLYHKLIYNYSNIITFIGGEYDGRCNP